MRSMIYILAALHIVLACNGTDPEPVEPPTVRIQDLAIEEGDATRKIFVDVRLNKPSTETVLVKLQSEDGTAKAGEDYVPVNNAQIEFQPGDLVVPYGIDILGDDELEEDEVFILKLNQPVGVEIGTSSVTITLLNDDDDIYVIPEDGYSTPESYPGMELIWRDEFNGSSLDETYWTHEIGTGCPGLCGWGNNELEYYRPENTYFQEGNLVIEAREESFGGRNYTSSRIITRNKFDFKHGRVDIRAVLPKGKGLWPALWMLGSNIGTVGWPACGEIDIMEMIGGAGGDNTVHGTAHWSDASGARAQYGDSRTLSQGIFSDEFHVFSITWDANSIEWYLDDVKYNTLSTTPANLSELRNNNYFFIFNVAVGGDWPGSPNAQTQFPQRMAVDYIRVFQDL